MIKSIEGLDNFYSKQYPSGEICREINRTTGKDYHEWVNTKNQPLYSTWGYNFGARPLKSIDIQYVGRSIPTPNPHNTLDALNHPILAWAEWESYLITGNKSRLGMVWEPLVKYYEALQKYIRQGNGLYMTDWASMDNSSRNTWLEGGGTAIDISAEMALFARNLADIAAVLGKKDKQKFYLKEAGDLSALINTKMWNEKKQFYFDLNLKEEQCSIKTIAGFWPLIGQVASPQQAEALKLQLQNPETFGRLYPVPTLAADEKDYNSRGGYWLGSVWAPTNTMVIRGLEKYGYDQLAYSIARKHIEQVAGVYQQTGTIWENYSADTLSAGSQSRKDFVGWSGMAPILYLLEYGVGLKPDAGSNTLTWHIRSEKKVGCLNYRFNGNTVSLTAEKNDKGQWQIEIESDNSFTLNVLFNQQSLKKKIKKGRQTFSI
jgi:glycogen debranching enzyme